MAAMTLAGRRNCGRLPISVFWGAFMSLLIDLELKSAFHVGSDPSWFDRNTSAKGCVLVFLQWRKAWNRPSCLMTYSWLERFTSTGWRNFSFAVMQTHGAHFDQQATHPPQFGANKRHTWYRWIIEWALLPKVAKYYHDNRNAITS